MSAPAKLPSRRGADHARRQAGTGNTRPGAGPSPAIAALAAMTDAQAVHWIRERLPALKAALARLEARP